MRKTLLVARLLLLGAMSFAHCAEDEAKSDAAFFGTAVAPFLQNYCVKCHGAENPKAKFSVQDLDSNFTDAGQIERWRRALEQMSVGDMPPEEARQPASNDRQSVSAWIARGLRQSGHGVALEHLLAQPENGNRVSHERLFDGSISGPVASPPRLWRLHPRIYDKFREKQFGFAGSQPGINQPFVLASMPGVFQGYSADLSIDEPTLGMLLANCETFAQWQASGIERRINSKPPRIEIDRSEQKAIRLVADSATRPTRDQLAAAIQYQFNYILRRDANSSEIERFVLLAERSIEKSDNAKGLAVALMAVLLQPEAVYRMELGLGAADEHGRRQLSALELAHAIAFALTDNAPDAVLLNAVKSGALSTRKDVEREVRRILADAKIEKQRILRFFHEFFGYTNAPLVFKGDRVNSDFSPFHLVRDADHLVLRILAEDKDVLRELLTTDRYCVISLDSNSAYEKIIRYIDEHNKNDKDPYFKTAREKGLRPIPEANPAWRRTVRFYNLNEATLDWQDRVQLTGQRSGILTHPAWLVAWSGNFDNDPIRRGKWIREHLLAGSIPDVPITVNAVVPEDPHRTLRDRLAVTREADCWQCHQKMDPLGLAFEHFDDLGRFRTNELTADKKAHPVEGRGGIVASGETKLDGDVKDVFELTQKLASSDRVRQSFVRHAFRYWMGRNERLVDSPVLIAADRAYVSHDGSFKEMLVALLTSDAFLYRK